MANFKIQADRLGQGLCTRCDNGIVYKRANGQTVSRCHVGMQNDTVPGDIVQCTDFEDRSAPTRWAMEKVAWTLNTDTSGKVLGFQPPKKDD